MNRVYLDPNTKYSDQYAMLAKLPDIVDEINEVADKAEQVPDPAVGDIGKVLGVVSDGESGAEYGAVEQSSGLPTISAGDAGKVLTVNDGETGAEWAAVPAELPAIGDSDAGKVLKVNASHTGVEWGAAGGGGLPFRVNYTFDENANEFICDKTLAQIFAAWSAGNFIYATIMDVILMPVKISEADQEIDFANFVYQGINTQSLIDVTTQKLVHLMDNNVETITFTYASGQVSVTGWAEAM